MREWGCMMRSHQFENSFEYTASDRRVIRPDRLIAYLSSLSSLIALDASCGRQVNPNVTTSRLTVPPTRRHHRRALEPSSSCAEFIFLGCRVESRTGEFSRPEGACPR